MMTKLTLMNHAQTNTTVLENEFIDTYMVEANGEYVKVYLLLLRHLNDPDGIPTISRIADMLDCTEKDVIRALNYWKKHGLLDYEAHPAAQRSAESSPDVPSIQQFRSRKEFRELLFVAEQYLGKTLSVTEVETITYLYETLEMSADLIEYLIEYCVDNNHKSIHYIKKVALAWHESRITTVEEARNRTRVYSKNYYSVLNAFGIRDRAPAPPEIEYIKRWINEYGFTQDIILEACTRTVNQTHTANFNYAESILKGWYEKGVHTLADIAPLDAEHVKSGKQQQARSAARQKAAAASARANNRFKNFDGRSYDMDDLERRLLQQ